MAQPIKMLIASTVLATLTCSPAWGQQKHHPLITIGHSGVKTLKTDVEYLLSLTSEAEQKQLANIIDFINLVIHGFAPERPIRVDTLTGTSPTSFVIWAPYENLADIKTENVESQWDLKKESEGLYKLLGQDQGWFRDLSKSKYGILVWTQNKNDLTVLKQHVLKLNNPSPEIAPLLVNSANMGAALINKATSEEDMTRRRDSFGEIRSNKLSALQKRPNESTTEFALRKQAVDNQLDELERLMVEAASASVRFILNRTAGSATVEFEASAIEGTSLATSLALFGQSLDAFDSVAKLDGSVLSLRVNHPIDELRQKHALHFIELMRDDTAARIKDDSKLTAEEKEASQELFDGIMEVVSDGIKTGNVNGFLESTVDRDGEFVSIAGVSAVDARRLDAALAWIAKTGNGNQIAINKSEIDGVNIHELRLAKGYLQLFDDLFGPEKTVYIGTSDSIVWIGTGKESLEMMTSTIQELGEPEANGTVITMEGNILPWAKRTLDLVKAKKLSNVAQERKRRDRQRSLELAVSSLARKDDARLEVHVEEGVSKGTIFVNTGVLRYLGREISFHAKNQLK